MAVLLSASNLSKAFGARPLFEGLSFAVESGERIGLIGPNGMGKSTLLRIVAGRDTPDRGTLSISRGLRVGYLEQVPQFKAGASVLATVMEGVPAGHPEWEVLAQAHALLNRLDLEDRAESKVEHLSGGWKKRVALARELMREPDLLLLDEPTNHLDVESILWIEEWLKKAPFATMTVTHDRAFLDKVSSRILELDRRNPGCLLSVNGGYFQYLQTKEAMISEAESRERSLKNLLRRETEWLRRGAKARTTKQQARIQRAEALGDEVGELSARNRSRSLSMGFEGAEKSPKKLVTAQGISKTITTETPEGPKTRTLFRDIDLMLGPGSRVGLLGPNGAGKSTLIRVLLGEQEPDAGKVVRSEQLQVAYFEQNRESLDPETTVLRTICPSGETVEYRGSRIHVKSYLDKFLFDYAQTEMPVGKLSGGEQSRLLLAILMLKSANLLVLDEPTNDLDLATLQVLEECLEDFPGAVLMVTHDRWFLDQVAERILSFSGELGPEGEVLAFTGLSQWEDWRAEALATREAARAKAAAEASKGAGGQSPSAGGAGARKRLSYKEQREFDGMEAAIHAAEEALQSATAESARPELSTNHARLAELSREMTRLHEEIDRLYARWAELEAKGGAS